MSWFHPEEEFQVGAVLRYKNQHRNTRYLVEFPDGESYVCLFLPTTRMRTVVVLTSK